MLLRTMPPVSPATVFREALTEAAQTALSHPLRSGLGALAMAAAVATVAIVSTALDGVTAFARATTARTFGSDTFVLAQIAERGRISRRELEDKLARNPIMRRSDLRFLARWSGDEVLYAGVAQRAADVIAGGRKFEGASVTGTGPVLADIRDLGLERGRFLSPDDELRAAPVAVIGCDVADQLFPGLDAVGRPIRLAGRRFEVIGVQGRLGTAAGASLDRYVWIPLVTWERVFGAPQSLEFFARARDTRLTAGAEDRARVTLRALRRLLPGVPDNFDILSPEAAQGLRERPDRACQRRRCPALGDGPAGGDRGGHQHDAGLRHPAHARDRRAPRARRHPPAGDARGAGRVRPGGSGGRRRRLAGRAGGLRGPRRLAAAAGRAGSGHGRMEPRLGAAWPGWWPDSTRRAGPRASTSSRR